MHLLLQPTILGQNYAYLFEFDSLEANTHSLLQFCKVQHNIIWRQETQLSQKAHT